MELQAGALQLNACGVVGPCRKVEGDDLDMNFLSDLLPSDRVEILPTIESEGSSPTASDAADTSSSTDELMATEAGRPKRTKKTMSVSSSSSLEIVGAEPEQEGRLVDRKARRRAQVASSARRLRCRKKNEMMMLKSQANIMEQQLEAAPAQANGHSVRLQRASFLDRRS